MNIEYYDFRFFIISQKPIFHKLLNMAIKINLFPSKVLIISIIIK